MSPPAACAEHPAAPPSSSPPTLNRFYPASYKHPPTPKPHSDDTCLRYSPPQPQVHASDTHGATLPPSVPALSLRQEPPSSWRGVTRDLNTADRGLLLQRGASSDTRSRRPAKIPHLQETLDLPFECPLHRRKTAVTRRAAPPNLIS
jgi:hypothetical protein